MCRSGGDMTSKSCLMQGEVDARRRLGGRRSRASPPLQSSNSSIVELVVVGSRAADPLRRRAALQELRGVLALARLARLACLPCCALGRIAADLGLQLDDVDELGGLPPQLIGDHGRL